jgi:hypothetical protein
MPSDMSDDEDAVYSFYKVDDRQALKEQVDLLLGNKIAGS